MLGPFAWAFISGVTNINNILILVSKAFHLPLSWVSKNMLYGYNLHEVFHFSILSKLELKRPRLFFCASSLASGDLLSTTRA